MIEKDSEVYITPDLINTYIKVKSFIEYDTRKDRQILEGEESMILPESVGTELTTLIDYFVNAQLAAMSVEELKKLQASAKPNSKDEPVIEMTWVLSEGNNPELLKRSRTEYPSEYEAAKQFLINISSELETDNKAAEKKHLDNEAVFNTLLAEIQAMQEGGMQ